MLLLLALALGAAAMREAVRRHWAFALLSAVAMGLPFAGLAGRATTGPRPSASPRRGPSAALLILTVPWVGGAVTPPVAWKARC